MQIESTLIWDEQRLMKLNIYFAAKWLWGHLWDLGDNVDLVQNVKRGQVQEK